MLTNRENFEIPLYLTRGKRLSRVRNPLEEVKIKCAASLTLGSNNYLRLFITSTFIVIIAGNMIKTQRYFLTLCFNSKTLECRSVCQYLGRCSKTSQVQGCCRYVLYSRLFLFTCLYRSCYFYTVLCILYKTLYCYILNQTV